MNQAHPSFQKYILITFILMTSVVQAQTRLSDIDNSRIRQKSIRNFLKMQMDNGIVYFENFKPSIDTMTDTSKFDSNIHRFQLQQTPEIAWNTYTTAHPAKIWQGRIVSCGFIYSSASRHVIFPDDKYPGLEQGQIFFIEMRVLCGLVKFPVCFMVTRINEGQHSITFSYVSSGSSKGAQTIRLMESGKGETEIIHSSIHQTDSWLRDQTLYPIYHRKAIKEVHRNINNMLQIK
jgi:hypothetical protein